jgi:hypothetical protein
MSVLLNAVMQERNACIGVTVGPLDCMGLTCAVARFEIVTEKNRAIKI